MNKNFQTLKVTLRSSRTQQTRVLEYEIRQHPVAQLWARQLKLSIPSGFKENDRFYNFVADPEKELATYIGRLKKNIEVLRKLHPELKIDDLDTKSLSSSINHLHYNFAHSRLVEDLVNDTNRKVWDEFNVLLHAIESVMESQKAVKLMGLPHARIVFTWNDHHRITTPDAFYDEYSLHINFGHVYINYAQTGRQIYEIYMNNDLSLHDEHIQPARFISGDTILWFGGDIGHRRALEIEKNIQEWFEKNKDRFNKLGLHWGEPKLALGQIAVGRLKNLPYHTKEMRAMIQELSEFDEVIGAEVE